MEAIEKERNDDPRAPMTLVVAIVGAVAVFVIVILLEAFFYQSEETERARKVYNQVPEELAGLRAQQMETLGRYRWVDQAHGIAGIPIDRAMELVVRDLGRTGSEGK